MKNKISGMMLFFVLLGAFPGCDSNDDTQEPQLPEVATVTSESDAVTDFTSVEITGSISGDDNISSYGVVWATSPNPTIEDNIALPESSSEQAVVVKSNTKQSQTRNFTVGINDLSPGTTYYFRTFATNEAGTAYGDQIIVETKSMAGTTWEFTMDESSGYPWIAHVTFHEDGTAFYTEPDNPGQFDFWGLWSMEDNHLTYQIREEWEDVYVLTGEVEADFISGTYIVFSKGAYEERTFSGEVISWEAE